MEKRAIIAVVLSLFVLIGYQFLFEQPVPETTKPDMQEPAPLERERPLLEEPGPARKPGRALPSRTAGLDEQIISVTTPLYEVELSSRGAVVRSWILKRYTDKQGMPINPLKDYPEIAPLAVGTGTDFALQSALFDVNASDLTLTSDRSEGSLVFTYASDQVRIRRTMTFHADSYRVDITDEVDRPDHYWVTIGEDFGIVTAGDMITHSGPVVLAGADRDEFKTSKLKEPRTLAPPDLKWVAIEDNYFFSSLVPLSGFVEAKLWERGGAALAALHLRGGESSYVLYAGPKDIGQLKQAGLELEHIVDFGFFSILSRPMFWLLKYINDYIGNYGWSIIILTIILRIPFIPLLNKGQKSMKKLQELQPKMSEIKEKYKKDPQKMQKEMMELYRKYKVNPMGGCLPMLLQIPFFFALYKVLLVAIELRGAPFLLWIEDLSAKDPYYVLPIVMGITMLIQQKMTPTSADPTQAKIMMFMPVIFTFLFLNFSSGLVLYWLMSNILSIIQQYFVNLAVKKEKEAAAAA